MMEDENLTEGLLASTHRDHGLAKTDREQDENASEQNANHGSSSTSSAGSERLASLDVVRGFSVALMIFVDDVGDAYPHIVRRNAVHCTIIVVIRCAIMLIMVDI